MRGIMSDKTIRNKNLDLLFLGPKSEQRSFFLETLQLLANDYIFWKRNYYPKDPPAISHSNLFSEEAGQYKDRFMEELFSLISDLKLDIPFFSPRYMAHMLSEVSLPATLSYFATMLYNPNNVAKESSPVTLDFELKAGQQFSQLFGYNLEKSFGHLTSGGTIANYESLFYNRTAKFLPVTMALSLKSLNISLPKSLDRTLWEICNIEISELEDISKEYNSLIISNNLNPTVEFQKFSYSFLGERSFIKQAENVFKEIFPDFCVILPCTAHYSWARSAHLFSLGKSNYLPVDVDENFVMDTESLKKVMDQCLAEKKIIIQIVAVCGSTEFGNFDNLEEIVKVRNSQNKKGLYSPIHVDAAYGGYFPTIFTKGERLNQPEDILSDRYDHLKRSCAAFAQSESITVDPHKMGYTPYGAGAFVIKNGFLKEFVAEKAAYIFDDTSEKDEDKLKDFHLGKYILEGSKPGAAAASVYFSNKMIPLSFDGYGAQLYELCTIANDFYELLLKCNNEWIKKGFQFIPVGRPQTNIQCFLVFHKSMQSIEEVNQFNKKLTEYFGIKKSANIQSHEYIISSTKVHHPSKFSISNKELSSLENNSDGVVLMRTVFMNRWVRKSQSKKIPYLNDFLNKVMKTAESLI